MASLRHGVYTETPVPCRLRSAGGARCRLAVAGASSRDDLKKNFDLDLRSSSGSTRRYRLSAMSGDPSGLRALLAFWSFERAGILVPRVEPIALWLNRTYAGLYLWIEPIDAQFFEARGERADALYKARNLLATLEDTTNLEAAFAVRIGSGTRNDIRELVLRLAAAARDPSLNLNDWVAADQILRYMASAAFVANWDGIINNYMLARTLEQPRFTIHPWDLDQTFEGLVAPTAVDYFDGNALMRYLVARSPDQFQKELLRFDRYVEPEQFEAQAMALQATIREAYEHDPLLNTRKLDPQVDALIERAWRQHEALTP